MNQHSQQESSTPVKRAVVWRAADGIGAALFGLALAALGFLFVVYLIYSANLFVFPFDYDQGEGFELWNAVLFSQGRWIYTDNEVFPFYSSLYGPVYPALLAPLVRLFGPHLWVGRVWSFLASLVIGGAIYRVVSREGRSRLMAVLAALAFYASNFVYPVGPLFRQHTTMAMFAVLGVVLMGQVHEDNDPRADRRRVLLALLMLLLAGFTKQLVIDAVLASFIFLFLRRPRWAVTCGLGFGAAAGLIFLLLNIATDGHWYTNIITANTNPFIDGQAVMFYRQWIDLHWPLTLVAVGYAVYALYFDRISVYSLYLVAAIATGALAGKFGAGLSYFWAAIIAACIGMGIGLGRLRGWLRQRADQGADGQRQTLARAGLAAWGIVVPLLLIGQARLNLHLPLEHPLTRPVARALGIPDEAPGRFRQDYFDTVGYTQIGHLTNADDVAAGWRLVEWVAHTPGPAWSEEAMPSIHAGKEVVTDPLVLFNLYVNGNLDPSQMVEMVEEQAFGVVIYRARFYPMPVLVAIDEHYGLVERVEMNGFVYDVLLPHNSTLPTLPSGPPGAWKPTGE